MSFVIVAINAESDGFSRSAVESHPEPIVNEKLVQEDDDGFGEHFLPLRSAVESIPTIVE